MKRICVLAAAAATVFTGTLMMVGAVASAHHNTVSCQSPGVWLIVNSEADKDETFTTDQGHSGTIGADAWVTVNYSGTSLTVHGTWENGVTHTDTGTGDCTAATTTTEATTSTVPATTTTGPTPSAPSTVPATTIPPTTAAPTTAAPTTLPPPAPPTPTPAEPARLPATH